MDESDKRPQFGQRYLDDDSRVFEHNAWQVQVSFRFRFVCSGYMVHFVQRETEDDVCWTEEQLKAAKQKVDENSVIRVQPAVRDQYEAEAAEYWDKFYGIHSNRFFKDRHWLFVEFPELLPGKSSSKNVPQDDGTEEYPGKAASLRILEIGCGVGNTVFPILDVNRDPGLFVYGCDFSPTAVSVLKPFAYFRSFYRLYETVVAFGLPIVVRSVTMRPIKLETLHAFGCNTVIDSVARYLKPGGKVIFRDYGRYDMAQLRFKNGRCIEDNFYARGDGTRVYFFTQGDNPKYSSVKGNSDKAK
ncbi:hypothetical protein HPB49_019707 [Dermacentor silvarum]|uniref:Uncharacterized protein n=1 Tax=Dermacentor silvarum TaxID=543639 RepID=A0ACB8DKB2_DERSI|nr:hypothetical protein HPB49_019707 [Dermacentor silvarum]